MKIIKILERTSMKPLQIEELISLAEATNSKVYPPTVINMIL